jgi:sugar O-acyltransferase (sialic acid O-acetyltransferase NeuD family)
MTELLIFPCNGNAIEAADCLGSAFKLVGFVDDNPGKRGMHATGVKVFDRKAFLDFPNAKVLAVPGSPTSYKQRREIIQNLGIEPGRFATVMHPAASVSPNAVIGRNVLIMAGTVVTATAVVKDHACILPNSVVHHDSIIGEYTLVGSGVVIAGYVTIHSHCYISSGSSVKNGVQIGARALVGMGSVVIRDVPEDAVVAGIPAKQIR